MRIVETHDPEMMRIDDDSVLLRVLGVFVIMVVIALWVLFLWEGLREEPAAPLWLVVTVLVGSLSATLCGIAMMLHAGQTIIDRRLRKVVTWRRLLWWKPSFMHDLDDFGSVQVVSSKGRHVSWGAELRAKPDRPECSVLCGLGLLRADARVLARRMAEFSGLAYRDERSDIGGAASQPKLAGRSAAPQRNTPARNGPRL
jgi:hypothetical protein